MQTGTLKPFTNDEDWDGDAGEPFTITDDETDELTDVDEIEIVVREQRSGSEKLSGSLTGGDITRITTGTYQWSFTAAAVGALCAGTYDVGIRATLSGSTKQLFVGTVAVIEGMFE